jgi:hypothetical protein
MDTSPGYEYVYSCGYKEVSRYFAAEKNFINNLGKRFNTIILAMKEKSSKTTDN